MIDRHEIWHIYAHWSSEEFGFLKIQDGGRRHFEKLNRYISATVQSISAKFGMMIHNRRWPYNLWVLQPRLRLAGYTLGFTTHSYLLRLHSLFTTTIERLYGLLAGNQLSTWCITTTQWRTNFPLFTGHWTTLSSPVVSVWTIHLGIS